MSRRPRVSVRRLRRLRPLSVALLAAVLVAACGGGGGEDAVPTVRLVTWKPNVPAAWEEVYRSFREANPDLRLAVEVGPHSSTAYHDLVSQKLKNRSRDIDVFLMDVIWPPEMAAAGWALALDERLPEVERQAFFSGALSANTWEGSLYGVPLYVDSGMLYYRRDLLEEHGLAPPRTWPELVEQARAITAAEAEGDVGGEGHGGLVGYSAQLKQYEGLVCNMLELVLGNGGRLVDLEAGRGALAREPALTAVRFLRDEVLGSVAPRGVLTYQEPESIALFIQGKAVFHRNWPYAWQVANDEEASAVAGAVGIAPLPHFPGGESHAALGGWQVAVSRFSPHPDLAWRLVEHLTGVETQKLLAIEAGLAPTRKALYDDPEVLAAQPHLEAMREVFASARPRPRSPIYPALSHVLQRYFSTVLSDPSADLEEAARAADAEIAELLALARGAG